MKLTNKWNLSPTLVDAVTNDPYTKGDADWSVTGLLEPPRKAELERRNAEALTEDVADRLASLYGQVVHGILERAEKTALPEERLYIMLDGVVVSGGVDRFEFTLEKGLLEDWKFVTTRKMKNGVPIEYEQQMNCYAAILRHNGLEVERANIQAIFRDYQASQLEWNPDYPPVGAIAFPVDLWTQDEAIEFLRQRIAAHQSARTSPTEQLPLCTPHERWASGGGYHVRKPGAKRSTRVYATQKEAEEHLAAFPASGYQISYEPSTSKRCGRWCLAAPFCQQYQDLKARGEAK